MRENNDKLPEVIKLNQDDYIVMFLHITAIFGSFLFLYILNYQKSDIGGEVFKFVITITSILSAIGFVFYHLLFWRFIINRARVLQKFKSLFNLI